MLKTSLREMQESFRNVVGGPGVVSYVKDQRFKPSQQYKPPTKSYLRYFRG